MMESGNIRPENQQPGLKAGLYVFLLGDVSDSGGVIQQAYHPIHR